MPNSAFFTELPEDFEDTRATLHAYAHAVDAIPRAHGTYHPKWWHVSLKVRPTGLSTDNIPLPGGGAMAIRMDLLRHAVVLESSTGRSLDLDMTSGMTATSMGDNLIEAAAELGLEGEYNRGKFENDEARPYSRGNAEAFLTVLVNVGQTFEEHRVGLEGPVGPVQLWPHGFDMAFEWFGTKTEEHEEHGEMTELTAQLNLGFYPGGRAYFYSNPWPFDESLTTQPLPHGAVWNTEGWQGSMLYYDQLAGHPDARQRLLDYAAAVHDVAAPTLMA